MITQKTYSERSKFIRVVLVTLVSMMLAVMPIMTHAEHSIANENLTGMHHQLDDTQHHDGAESGDHFHKSDNCHAECSNVFSPLPHLTRLDIVPAPVLISYKEMSSGPAIEPPFRPPILHL